MPVQNGRVCMCMTRGTAKRGGGRVYIPIYTYKGCGTVEANKGATKTELAKIGQRMLACLLLKSDILGCASLSRSLIICMCIM